MNSIIKRHHARLVVVMNYFARYTHKPRARITPGLLSTVQLFKSSRFKFPTFGAFPISLYFCRILLCFLAIFIKWYCRCNFHRTITDWTFHLSQSPFLLLIHCFFGICRLFTSAFFILISCCSASKSICTTPALSAAA